MSGDFLFFGIQREGEIEGVGEVTGSEELL
jgi:hypothetical protein